MRRLEPAEAAGRVSLLAGNLIFDPCIGVADVPLVCPAKPWSSRYVGISSWVTIGHGGQAVGTPWGIQLATGQRCSLLAGVTDTKGPDRLNYDCGGAGLVYGDATRGRRVWTVQVARKDGDGALATVPLRRVWY